MRPFAVAAEHKFVEWDQWNPFVPVATTSCRRPLYEPLAFYSAFGDKSTCGSPRATSTPTTSKS
jgi:hypothetical protein